MSLSTLPLSYCTNVHPGRMVAEVFRGVQEYTAPVARNCGGTIAAGLWLAQPVVRELNATAGALEMLREMLARQNLACYTLNAFPYGDFHQERVKEQVYLPDWSQPERLSYTVACAKILAQLLPEGVEGSISTVPLGFKGFAHPLDFSSRCCANLIELARQLDRLAQDTGRIVRLAVEPEPFCVLETTAEALQFFEVLWQRASEAGAAEIVRRHIGLCYDVCHQAVEFEEVPASIAAFETAGVRINKLHITCALQLDQPGQNQEGREALARYVEPRYLHQTIGRTSTGVLLRSCDLSASLTATPPREFAEAEAWRIHFHVPVNADRLGPLGTTRPQLIEALNAVAALPYAPHLEVETYTWEVLPGATTSGTTRLVDGLTAELLATKSLLAAVPAR